MNAHRSLLASAMSIGVLAGSALGGELAWIRDRNDCAAGDRLLTHVVGTDGERRLAIERIADTLHLAPPECNCGETPSWIEWPTAYSISVSERIEKIEHVERARSNSGTFHESALYIREQSLGEFLNGWREFHPGAQLRQAGWNFIPEEQASTPRDNQAFAPPAIGNRPLREAIGTTDVHVRPDPAVKVAVVDTGVAKHPFLQSVACTRKMEDGTCAALGRRVAAQSDVQYTVSEDACYGEHATFVAGAIAGNRDGVDIGVFPGVPIDSWSAARSCERGEMNDFCTSGLQWLTTLVAAADEAKVINLSYETNCEEPALSLTRDAFARLRAKDVVLVSGTPNEERNLDGTCVQDLGNAFDNVLFAAPLGRNNAPNAAYGNHSVMLGVPFGTLNNNMCTTTYRPVSRTGCPAAGTGYGFEVVGEASMATAVVSAAAAMVLSDPRYRTCTASQVVEILLKQAIPHPKLKGGVLSLKFLEDDAPLVDIACARPWPAAITPRGMPSRH